MTRSTRIKEISLQTCRLTYVCLRLKSSDSDQGTALLDLKDDSAREEDEV